MGAPLRLPALAGLISAALGACEGGPRLLVELSGLPRGSAFLHTSAGARGREARPMEPFTLPAGIERASLVLRLPSEEEGPVTIGAAALDERECLLGTAALGWQREDGEEVRARMDALAAPRCASLPIFIAASPPRAPTNGMVEVLLRGFGFREETRVRFGDMDSPRVTFRSSVEVSALVPARRGFGKVPLSISQPDAAEVDAGTFSYFSTTLEFMSYPVDLRGNECTAIAIGDLDGNLVPDLVIASRARGDIGVVLNDRVGPRLPTSYAVGPQPSAVAIGDLNQDGLGDIAVTDFSDGVVSVFTNRGGGSFRDGNIVSVVRLPVDAQPSSIAIADMNGDAKQDLIVACQGTNSVNVLINQGGTFTAPRAYPLFFKPRVLAIADTNGDGRPDIVLTSTSGTTLTVMVNAGDGTFPRERSAAYLVGEDLTALAVADLDADGLPDVVMNNGASRSVAVLLNRGGEFPPAARIDVAIGKGALALAIGDVNGDDQPDVVAASAEDQSVTLIMNESGRFSRYPIEFQAGIAPLHALVGDIDFDGRADIGLLGADHFVGLQNRSK